MSRWAGSKSRLARRWQRAQRQAAPDRGSITLWVAVTFAAILAVAGLVADGGARIRAGERADIVAGEAARAASYASGPDDNSRTAAAAAAARGIISRAGMAGSVAVAAPGRIDVTVQASATGPISGLSYTVSRNATAQLLLGVRTGGTP
jgi:hypothetical protein